MGFSSCLMQIKCPSCDEVHTAKAVFEDGFLCYVDPYTEESKIRNINELKFDDIKDEILTAARHEMASKNIDIADFVLQPGFANVAFKINGSPNSPGIQKFVSYAHFTHIYTGYLIAYKITSLLKDIEE